MTRYLLLSCFLMGSFALGLPSSAQTLVDVTNAPLNLSAIAFADESQVGFYIDKKKWLAVNPMRDRVGVAEKSFPFPTGNYDLTLHTVGENDGRSTYEVSIDGVIVGTFVNPASEQTYQTGSRFESTWNTLAITEGAIIRVKATIDSADGKEFSRARWSSISFAPADVATRAEVQSFYRRNAAQPNDRTRPKLQQPRQPDGDGAFTIDGDRQVWHKISLTLDGPYAHELDTAPNPFTDYRLTGIFTHRDGTKYEVPGFFAADGDAANSSADSGTAWRVHFAPDRTGEWAFQLNFVAGPMVALDPSSPGQPVAKFHGKRGTLNVEKSDKMGRDLRAHGRLEVVGKHYLQFAGTGQYFLKVGADAPETLLAYRDFDNTLANNPKKAPLKSWSPHVKDWLPSDPTWAGGKGKGLIGAVNYLSGKGCNAFSFLTYNAGGDGDNVWPFVDRDDKFHYDCSKLDQWAVVFDHGTHRGMYLHFKMQETENDDRRGGRQSGAADVCLDGGDLGPERMLYCRELIARFGHNLALNWNIGEENTQTTEQQIAMINAIADLDAYNHPIVIHTFPGQKQHEVYTPLLGDRSRLTGASLQNSSLETTHSDTVKWVTASAQAGKPWVVAFDESGSAAHAQCPDLGYRGFDGHDRAGKMVYTQHKVRKQTLWGTLLGGGAGCEYYFGYQFDENDIVCEDWRSRDQSWDYCRIAIGFFHDHQLPFWEMSNADELVGNPEHDNSRYCFAKPGDVYLVYLPDGGHASLDLSADSANYTVSWFNPRVGGEMVLGSIESVTGGQVVEIGTAPSDANEDWLVMLRRR